MATTAKPDNDQTLKVKRAHPRRSESSSRGRSILLSGNKPVGHGEPVADISVHNVEREPAPSSSPPSSSHPTANAQSPRVPDAEAEADGRPPSIHLSEHEEPTVATVTSGETRYALTDAVDPSESQCAQMPPPPCPHAGMVASRPRRMTLDLPGSPIDVLYESDHKLSLEGTSPKPCIVPGNALHLIDDDPAAPRSATPPSLIIVGDESEHGDPEGDTDIDDIDDDIRDHAQGRGPASAADRSASQPPPSSAARPAPRVRFRSRVRITSGLHRHRHSTSTPGAGVTSTPGSETTTDSPSSSISAPLRYQADENAAWGPIGKRLSAYTASGGWQRRMQVSQGQIQGKTDGDGTRGGAAGRRVARGGQGYTERTPLLRPVPGAADTDEDTEDMSEEERAVRAAALRREEEAVFGKWPWRVFNRHWWWYHAEPVLCCCCADDSDYEEF